MIDTNTKLNIILDFLPSYLSDNVIVCKLKYNPTYSVKCGIDIPYLITVIPTIHNYEEINYKLIKFLLNRKIEFITTNIGYIFNLEDIGKLVLNVN